MDKHIKLRHNKTLLLYHVVCPVKYRKEVFNESVSESLVTVCKEISIRYEIRFLEIGIDSDHVHFLIQTVPTISVSKLVKKVKSLTAREIFRNHPEVRNLLWGGKFWTGGYYANTVGAHGREEVIREYIRNQGNQSRYKRLSVEQIGFFDSAS